LSPPYFYLVRKVICPSKQGVLQSAAAVLALNLLVQVGGRSQTVRLSDARTCTRAWLAFGPLGTAHRLEGL